MINLSKWQHKDEWWQPGKDFLIVVKHHTTTLSSILPEYGEHRWSVYAYIYPKHRLFDSFQGNHMFQPAIEVMPLHGGCSSLRWHNTDEGEKTSVQVGADYNHLYDDHFTHYAKPDEAQQVFADADELFDYLTTGGAA